MQKIETKNNETLELKVVRKWGKDASIRAEFGDLNKYYAYVVAHETGRARIYPGPK